jgi:energy-coupling factor transporter ATP-binding protein EcfA2
MIDDAAGNVPVFSVSGLSFRYERRVALSCDALEIMPGQSVALTGPNGSGKTTMLKLLNGLLGPFTGSIAFMGKPLARNPLLRQRSVYVHQHPVMFAGTVRDNLEYALRLKRVPKEEAARRIAETAGRLGIGSLLDREAARLSGGETQRAAVARAVAAGADVLLLDEPTSSMDSGSEAAMRGLLIELRRSGATLVFSAHDDGFVQAVADREIRFDAGRAIVQTAQGDTQ